MKERWSTIRQSCLLAFLVLLLIENETNSRWMYYVMLPLILLCFIIDLFQFRGKSRAGKFRKLYLRLFDMFLLIMYVALIAVLLMIVIGIS